MSDTPTFDPSAAMWANTVLLQALLVQLITTKKLTVREAESVFDIAVERAKKERAAAPDAERLINHVHDNLKWDEYYAWEAQERRNNGG